MAKRPISTLSFSCPTCGVAPQARCLSLKPGVALKRQHAQMLIHGETRLIKSHQARRLLAQGQKVRPGAPR